MEGSVPRLRFIVFCLSAPPLTHQQTTLPSGHCYCHHIRPLKGLEESQHLSVCPIVGVQNHQIHNQVTTVVAFSHPSTIGPIIPFSGTIMSMPHGCMVSGCVASNFTRRTCQDRDCRRSGPELAACAWTAATPSRSCMYDSLRILVRGIGAGHACEMPSQQ